MISTDHKIQQLPLQQEIESRAVLKAAAAAHRRLAKLKGVARSIPNETILISREIHARIDWTELIASWNADTPAGTWIETQISARFGSRWTKWYNLGVWAADPTTIERHSVNLQGDGDGFVAVDTLVLTNKKETADAFQLKVRLFSVNTATPTVRNMSVAFSTTAGKPGTLPTGDSGLWNKTLDVPQCSQMVYPDGGEVWCSPTSTSMVIGLATTIGTMRVVKSSH